MSNQTEFLKQYLPNDIIDYIINDYLFGCKQYWNGQFNKVVIHLQLKYCGEMKERMRQMIDKTWPDWRTFVGGKMAAYMKRPIEVVIQEPGGGR